MKTSHSIIQELYAYYIASKKDYNHSGNGNVAEASGIWKDQFHANNKKLIFNVW